MVCGGVWWCGGVVVVVWWFLVCFPGFIQCGACSVHRAGWIRMNNEVRTERMDAVQQSNSLRIAPPKRGKKRRVVELVMF